MNDGSSRIIRRAREIADRVLGVVPARPSSVADRRVDLDSGHSVYFMDVAQIRKKGVL